MIVFFSAFHFIRKCEGRRVFYVCFYLCTLRLTLAQTFYLYLLSVFVSPASFPREEEKSYGLGR